MHYKLDPYDRESVGQVFSLDGERAGVIQEADTSEGYIKRIEYIPGETTHPLIIIHGRVDYLGNWDKDTPRVIFDRLNQVRAELGLVPYDVTPFLDE